MARLSGTKTRRCGFFYACATLAALLVTTTTTSAAVPCCIDLPWALHTSQSNLILQDEFGPWAGAPLGWRISTDTLDPLLAQPYIIGRVQLNSSSSSSSAAIVGASLLSNASHADTQRTPYVVGVFEHWQSALLRYVSTLVIDFTGTDDIVQLQHVSVRRSIANEARSSVRIDSYNGAQHVLQRTSLWSSSLTDTLYEYAVDNRNVTRVRIEFYGNGYGALASVRACTSRADATLCALCANADTADVCAAAAATETPSASTSATPTPSTTPAPSQGTSATITASNSMSASARPSESTTSAPTASATPTPSTTASLTLGASESPSGTQTSSASSSTTPSASTSTTASATLTASASASSGATHTPTPSTSGTPSVTPLPDAQLACSTGLLGVCGVGHYERNDQQAIVCVSNVQASAERCDALDNDCNGLVDDALPTLHCGVGECRRAQYSCVLGVEHDVCVEGAPEPELCDALDNDCNGLVDEQNVCGDQVFVLRSAAAVPLPYCIDATTTTAHFHVLVTDLALANTQWQVEVQVRDDASATTAASPVSGDALPSLSVSHLDAFRYNMSGDSSAVALRIRTVPATAGPAARALPRPLAWQSAVIERATAPACSDAPPLAARFVRDDDDAQDDDDEPLPLEPVVPLLDSCVLRRDELCSLSFGYYNPNANVLVMHAHRNTLNTSDATLQAALATAQYQSTTLLPGRVYAAMTVQTQCRRADDASWYVQWQLGELRARATLALNECTADAVQAGTRV